MSVIRPTCGKACVEGKQRLPGGGADLRRRWGGMRLLTAGLTLAVLLGCGFERATETVFPSDTAARTRMPTGTRRPSPAHTTTPAYEPITWNELTSFISDDHTNWNEYVPGRYVCLDYAVDLVAAAAGQHVKAWIVAVTFVGEENAHAFVAFETTDYDVVYIEPQTDNPYWLMEVGKLLCDSWGLYECLGEVETIEYYQCNHAAECSPFEP